METQFCFTPIEESLTELLNDIVIEKDGAKVSIKATFSLPSTLSFFAGHFPDEPVLPAVLQLTIVRLLSSKATHSPLQNTSLGKTKFMNIIRPEEKIKVDIDLCRKDQKIEVKFAFYNEGKMASIGKINYNIV